MRPNLKQFGDADSIVGEKKGGHRLSGVGLVVSIENTIYSCIPRKLAERTQILIS
jgi:hypothetical protein